MHVLLHPGEGESLVVQAGVGDTGCLDCGPGKPAEGAELRVYVSVWLDMRGEPTHSVVHGNEDGAVAAVCLAGSEEAGGAARRDLGATGEAAAW